MRKWFAKRVLRWIRRGMKSSYLKSQFIKEGNKIVDLPDELGFDEKREAAMLGWLWENGVNLLERIIDRYL